MSAVPAEVGTRSEEPRGEGRRFVFLSYKRGEAGQAELIRKRLEDAGFDVWWDQRIQCGAVWNEALDEAVREAGCIVVLWSVLSVESPWVSHEASIAIGRGVYAPVRIDLCPIKTPFDRLQATDLIGFESTPDHPGFARLLQRVDELLPPRKPWNVRLLEKTWARRTAIAAVSFAIAALVILAWQTLAAQSQLLLLDEVGAKQREQSEAARTQLSQLDEVVVRQQEQAETARSQLTQLEEIITRQGEQTSAARSQLSQLNEVLQQQERQSHPILFATSRLDATYQRFTAYFRYWKAELDGRLRPTRGFSLPDTGLRHSSVLRRIPRPFLEKLSVAVDAVNDLILRAEVGGDVAVFRALMRHARTAENAILEDERFSFTEDEEYLITYHQPLSEEEAAPKALLTIDHLLKLYGEIRPTADGTCFALDTLGGGRRSRFEVLQHDLYELGGLASELLHQDAAFEDRLIDDLEVSFPYSGFSEQECNNPN